MNEWMNEWMMHLYSAFIVHCHTPKALEVHEVKSVPCWDILVLMKFVVFPVKHREAIHFKKKFFCFPVFPLVIVHRSVCSFWCVAVCFCLWPGWMSALLGNSLCWRVNQANHPGAHFGLPYIYSCVAVILYQIVALISLSYSVLSSVPVFSSLILVWITCCHCCSWISMTTG